MLRRVPLRTTRLGGLLAVGMLALIVWACGGGSAEDDAEVQALLSQMTLTEEDMPVGLVRVSAFVSTNQDVAEAVIDTEAELVKLERWGRRLGYDVQFEPGPEAPADSEVQGLQNTVSIYRTEDGASDSFADAAGDSRETDWASLYPGVGDLKVEEIERPDLAADEYVWFRISGVQESDDKLIIDDQVAFRKSNVRSFLRVVTLFDPDSPRDSYLDQVETWVRRVNERIENALEMD